MPILEDVNESAARLAAQQVRQIIAATFRQLADAADRGHRLIWSNPDATPAEVLAELGTDAKAVFQLAQLNGQTIVAAAPILGADATPTVPGVPAGVSIAFDADGRAAVTQQ